MPNLDLTLKKDLSTFRRIAIGSWRTTFDPSVYGTMEIRMDKALEYIEAFRAASGKRLTITHMVAKAIASALAACPDANAILRFNRIYLRNGISTSLLVVLTDEGSDRVDLSAVNIQDIDKKSIEAIVDEVEERLELVRSRKDPQLEKGRSIFKRMPLFLMNRILDALAFVIFTLNLDPKWVGLPRDPFGSVVISNVGSLALDIAYVPLVPYTRVPIFVAIGTVQERPVVEDGQIVVGHVMNVCATFDHRFIDGFHASVMARTLHRMLEDPFTEFGPVPAAPVEPPGASQEAGEA